MLEAFRCEAEEHVEQNAALGGAMELHLDRTRCKALQQWRWVVAQVSALHVAVARGAAAWVLQKLRAGLSAMNRYQTYVHAMGLASSRWLAGRLKSAFKHWRYLYLAGAAAGGAGPALQCSVAHAQKWVLAGALGVLQAHAALQRRLSEGLHRAEPHWRHGALFVGLSMVVQHAEGREHTTQAHQIWREGALWASLDQIRGTARVQCMEHGARANAAAWGRAQVLWKGVLALQRLVAAGVDKRAAVGVWETRHKKQGGVIMV